MDRSLITQLKGGSAQERRAASYKMGKSKEPMYVPHLIRAYNDQDASIRRNVLDGLKRIGTDEANAFLKADEAERQQLVERAGGLATVPAALRNLMRMLQSDDWTDRRYSVEELGKLDESNPHVVGALMGAKIADEEERVREAAAQALLAPAHQAILEQRPDLQFDQAAHHETAVTVHSVESVQWPCFCIGCFAAYPSQYALFKTISVEETAGAMKNVGAATTVGTLAGGLIGGVIVGGIAAAMAEAGASSSAVPVPICERCARALPTDSPGTATMVRDSSADGTWFLGFKRVPGGVALLFENKAYRAAFRRLNESNLGDPSRLPDIGSEGFGQILQRLILPYAGNPDVYVGESTPAKKMSNARQSCRVPQDERVLAIVDCTVMGSVKNCLLFSSEAIYYHNGKGTMYPGPGRIPFSEFAQRTIEMGSLRQLSLGEGQILDASGCSVPTGTLVGILQSIQELLEHCTLGEDRDEDGTPRGVQDSSSDEGTLSSQEVLEQDSGTESERAEAAKHLEKAYELDSADDFASALEECDRAQKAAPEWAEPHNLRGMLLEELGRKQEALSAYREAIRLDPAFSEAAENLEEALAEEQNDGS